MPAPTRELVEALYEAFSVRDLEAVIALIDRKFVFRPAVTAELTNRPSYHGHAGMREYFGDVERVWAELRLVPQRFQPVGDALLVLGRVYARTAAGTLLDTPAGWVWEGKAGKLTQCSAFQSHADALQAVGLSEQDAKRPKT
jgi:ketosteroid isomerase-like protein